MCCLFTSGTVTGVLDHLHLKSTFKRFQPIFILDKPSLIPTLPGAQVRLYNFYQKQLIAQSNVIETQNVCLLSCVACLSISGCCVYVLYCLLQTSLSSCVVSRNIYIKIFKATICILFSSTGAELLENLEIT